MSTYFCFECDDKNRCASAETCHAGRSGYPRRTIEGTSEQALQELELEQEADGRWLAEFTRFPGVAAYGPSKEEAIRNAAKVLIQPDVASEQASPTPEKCPTCGSRHTWAHEQHRCPDSWHSSAPKSRDTGVSLDGGKTIYSKFEND